MNIESEQTLSLAKLKFIQITLASKNFSTTMLQLLYIGSKIFYFIHGQM